MSSLRKEMTDVDRVILQRIESAQCKPAVAFPALLKAAHILKGKAAEIRRKKSEASASDPSQPAGDDNDSVGGLHPVVSSGRLPRHASFSGRFDIRESRISKGTTLLRERLANLKLKLVDMKGDGNCQFRAAAHGIFGDARHHPAVRSKVVKHMRARPDDFGIFFEGSGFDEYLSDMASDGTWGDEICVKAISDCFKCTIHLITSNHDNWRLRYEPSIPGEEAAAAAAAVKHHHIFMTYIAPIHYDAIGLAEES
eukprot:GHVU01001113.1.p1 GENE.GHVU01001113.1~~GHVU01001113.1.p1  ORF type:complete len:254 (-),score=57.57 GHVU01001113.1:199-960(-)